jgi:hypothetical protein
MAKKRASRTATRRKRAPPRTRISPKGDTRFVRRSTKGRFEESDDAGKSLARDPRTKARAKAKKGQGDRGDRRR